MWTCSQSVCGYMYRKTVQLCNKLLKGYTLASTVAVWKCIASHNCVQMQMVDMFRGVCVCVCVVGGGQGTTVAESKKRIRFTFYCSTALQYGRVSSEPVMGHLTIVLKSTSISSHVSEAWKFSSSSWHNWDQSLWQCCLWELQSWRGPRWWPPVWETGRVQTMITLCTDTYTQ